MRVDPLLERLRGIGGWTLTGATVVLLSHCSPERRVLATAPSSVGGTTSASKDGEATGGGTFVGGSAGMGATTTGGTGGSVTATGGTGAAPATAGSSATGGSAAAPDAGSTSAGGSSTAGVAGATDSCGAVTCPASCTLGFELMAHKHRGCLGCECAPVNECSKDADCPSGSVCYAGLQCDDGCSTPDCCSGNHCGPPGCPAPLDLPCAAFGCANGDSCEAACSSAVCKCDGTNWTCSYDGGAATSCASSCSAP